EYDAVAEKYRRPALSDGRLRNIAERFVDTAVLAMAEFELQQLRPRGSCVGGDVEPTEVQMDRISQVDVRCEILPASRYQEKTCARGSGALWLHRVILEGIWYRSVRAFLHGRRRACVRHWLVCARSGNYWVEGL